MSAVAENKVVDNFEIIRKFMEHYMPYAPDAERGIIKYKLDTNDKHTKDIRQVAEALKGIGFNDDTPSISDFHFDYSSIYGSYIYFSRPGADKLLSLEKNGIKILLAKDDKEHGKIIKGLEAFDQNEIKKAENKTAAGIIEEKKRYEDAFSHVQETLKSTQLSTDGTRLCIDTGSFENAHRLFTAFYALNIPYVNGKDEMHDVKTHLGTDVYGQQGNNVGWRTVSIGQKAFQKLLQVKHRETGEALQIDEDVLQKVKKAGYQTDRALKEELLSHPENNDIAAVIEPQPVRLPAIENVQKQLLKAVANKAGFIANDESPIEIPFPDQAEAEQFAEDVVELLGAKRGLDQRGGMSLRVAEDGNSERAVLLKTPLVQEILTGLGTNEGNQLQLGFSPPIHRELVKRVFSARMTIRDNINEIVYHMSLSPDQDVAQTLAEAEIDASEVNIESNYIANFGDFSLLTINESQRKHIPALVEVVRKSNLSRHNKV